MKVIDSIQAMILLAEHTPAMAAVHPKIQATSEESTWRQVWILWNTFLTERIAAGHATDLARSLELMEHLAIHGDQVVLDAICIESVEKLVDHVKHDISALVSLLGTMGPRCRAYAIAWMGADPE
jgi:hypothetical protein